MMKDKEDSASSLSPVEENFELENGMNGGVVNGPESEDGLSGLSPEESAVTAKPKNLSTVNRKLSTTSGLYDRNMKGYLDPTESKMRELDASNRGYLTNDRVYQLMKESVAMQKQMVTQKKLIWGLAVFSVILALANMGTAFAAASLAKETTVNGEGELTGVTTTEERTQPVKTTPKGKTYGVGESKIYGFGQGFLDGLADQIGNGDARLLEQYNVTSDYAISKADAEGMYSDVSNSITTSLQWKCVSGGYEHSEHTVSVTGGSSEIIFDEDTGSTDPPTEIGTKYEYSVDLYSAYPWAVTLVCSNSQEYCIVSGINCCTGFDDCPLVANQGGVETQFECNPCGCKCQPPGPMCRMSHSICSNDAGDPI